MRSADMERRHGGRLTDGGQLPARRLRRRGVAAGGRALIS